MITLFTMLGMLMCPETIVVNKTKTWTKHDIETLVRVKIRCGEIYRDAPCAKLFIKTEERAYQVVCGSPE